MLLSRGILVFASLVTASSAVMRFSAYTSLQIINLLQGGSISKQKLLGLIDKLHTIVEQMKFPGDDTKSTTSAAAVEKNTEAPPTQVKITPAAFVQGKLKHLI
jgi:hypothetical protein